jgi:hypothetical protein
MDETSQPNANKRQRISSHDPQRQFSVPPGGLSSIFEKNFLEGTADAPC